jgi:hypothetical protein
MVGHVFWATRSGRRENMKSEAAVKTALALFESVGEEVYDETIEATLWALIESLNEEVPSDTIAYIVWALRWVLK